MPSQNPFEGREVNIPLWKPNEKVSAYFMLLVICHIISKMSRFLYGVSCFTQLPVHTQVGWRVWERDRGRRGENSYQIEMAVCHLPSAGVCVCVCMPVCACVRVRACVRACVQVTLCCCSKTLVPAGEHQILRQRTRYSSLKHDTLLFKSLYLYTLDRTHEKLTACSIEAARCTCPQASYTARIYA
jgi:hypothetical protein